MKLSMTVEQLVAYVTKQVSNNFPDDRSDVCSLHLFVDICLQRVEYCFSRINSDYYHNEGQIIFNHLHSDQYAAFLYFLANTVWHEGGNPALASKLYYLNKLLHSVDIYYAVELPAVFCLVHPVGTVLGRARYDNYFVAYQRCTVGGNLALEYPVVGEGVAMFAGSSLIGRCQIGSNSAIAAGALVMDTDVPADHVAFGMHPAVQFKPASTRTRDRFFLPLATY